MKTERVIGVAVLVALALAFGYGLGYQQGSRDAETRLSSAKGLKRIGLGFRIGRNDLSIPFSVTGSVATPQGQAPKQ